MKIIQVTDLHLVAPGRTLFGLDPLARLDACLADIEARHADADLVIFSGDLADRGEAAAYRALRERLTGLTPPWRLMLGNHDERGSFAEVFPDLIDETGFAHTAVDTEHGRLLLLDTLVAGEIGGRLCPARRGWLDARLSEAKDGPVYVFSHHPPFPVHVPGLDRWPFADAQALHAALQAHGHVRHIFAGHVHRPIAGSWRGIPFSTLRGTNHQSGLDFSAEDVHPTPDPPAYAIVFITPDDVVVHFHDFPV